MLLMVPLVVSVTVMDLRAEVVTVMVVDPEIDGVLMEVAVMVALPALTAVARPPALMVAMVASEDDQVALTLAVLPSSLTPLAVNCCVLPTAMVGVLGVTVIEVSTGPVKKPRHEGSSAMTVVSPAVKTTLRMYDMKYPVRRSLRPAGYCTAPAGIACRCSTAIRSEV